MCLGAIVMANIRSIVFGMPDNHISPRAAIEHVPYIRQRVHNYVGGVLAEGGIALHARYSEEEARMILEGTLTGDTPDRLLGQAMSEWRWKSEHRND